VRSIAVILREMATAVQKWLTAASSSLALRASSNSDVNTIVAVVAVDWFEFTTVPFGVLSFIKDVAEIARFVVIVSKDVKSKTVVSTFGAVVGTVVVLDVLVEVVVVDEECVDVLVELVFMVFVVVVSVTDGALVS